MTFNVIEPDEADSWDAALPLCPLLPGFTRKIRLIAEAVIPVVPGVVDPFADHAREWLVAAIALAAVQRCFG